MAYRFNGSDQWLNTTTPPVTAMPWTLACWFNVDETTTVHTLMGISDSTATTEGTFLAVRGNAAPDPLSARYVGGGGFINADSSTGVTAGTWHHGVAVFASKTDFRVYLDGGNAGANTSAGDLGGTMNDFSIGRMTRAVPDLYTAGLIAECVVWNIALTAAQAARAAQRRNPYHVAPESIVFYDPLVRTLRDEKGGLILTNNGGATIAAHPPIVRPRARVYFLPAAGGGGNQISRNYYDRLLSA